jgi:general secretion pathway protein C
MSLSDHQTKLLEVIAKLPQKKIAQAITVFILIYIAYLCAQVTWLLLPQTKINNEISANISATKKFTAKNVNLSSLQSLNLFGRYNEPSVEQVIEVKDAPETRLNLTLTGVVASDDKNVGAAIIANAGKQNTYGIGEIITGTRATLEQVMNDRVLIKQSGRLETLMLDGFKYQKDTNLPVTKSLSARTKQKTKNKKRALDQRKNKALRVKMAQLKADIANNPAKITDYLKISPQKKQGKIIGYRLMPGKDSDFFRASGLKPGDVAIALNGFELSQPMQAAQALKALKEDTEVSLTIDRQGEINEILFSISKKL